MALKDPHSQEIENIRNLVASNHIAEAILALRKTAENNNSFAVVERINGYENTYKYLLHYLTEGVQDPTRKDQLNNLKQNLQEICNELEFGLLAATSNKEIFAARRLNTMRHTRLADLFQNLENADSKIELAHSAGQSLPGAIQDRDAALRSIFDYVVSSYKDKEGYRTILDRAVQSKNPNDILSLILPALTLSLIEFYDPEKFRLLLDLYDQIDDDETAAKCITAVVLVMNQHKKALKQDVQSLRHLEVWKDSILTYSRLRDVVKNIIRTRDTERASAKMKDEIIPEMMKIRPDILKKMKDGGFDEESLLENNPEWEDMLDKSGLSEKMRELTEMQNEGADLLMVTFENLKNFPFFNSMSSWFLPFDINNPAISLNEESRKALNSFVSLGGNMCDSDKYSLALAFASMPAQQREQMFGQLQSQLSQMMEQMEDLSAKQSRLEFNSYAVRYVRDLYRLFKLYRRRDNMTDPFVAPLDFISLPVLGSMLSDDEMINVVAEFYFKRGYHKEALRLFEALEGELCGEYNYWEKRGYSLQSLARFEEAYEAYQRAEFLNKPNMWLLKRLAFTARQLGRNEDAASYYARALENDSENISLILNTAYSLADTGKYSEALPHLYHANYLEPDNEKVWRSLAWIEFINGNLDKSDKYYTKIIQRNPTASDFMNAGHVQLVRGNIKGALALYRKSAEAATPEFEKAFRNDYPLLEKHGIDTLTLDLLLDSLRL